MTLFALAGGSLIFLAALVVIVFGLGISYYRSRRSGINPHPHDGRDAPGAGGPSALVGSEPGRMPESPDGPGSLGSISTHGTK
ncbi:MAG TPA: hypothetical protein VE983_09415 [Solirubrobacteraceae bacterium]|nr:hypothetical protein [Solirubrobacteraceae bacterium]